MERNRIGLANRSWRGSTCRSKTCLFCCQKSTHLAVCLLGCGHKCFVAISVIHCVLNLYAYCFKLITLCDSGVTVKVH